jgi:putative redox protein
MDILDILRKKRQPPLDFRIRVRGKRAETYPMVYTEIEVTYLLWGERISSKAVEHAIELSERKYCSVGVMLGAMANVRHTYRILPPGEEEKPIELEAGVNHD